MKSVKAPLKQQWDKKEYIQCRNASNKFNGIELGSPELVRCSYCINEIKESVVQVVEFGLKVACRPCFNARYRNRRQIWKHFTVPPTFDVQKANSDIDKAMGKSAVEKAVEIQNQNVTQIRQGFSKVDEPGSPATE